MLSLKFVLRLAGRIQAALRSKAEQARTLEQALLSRLLSCLRAFHRAAGRLDKARGRGWLLVLPRLGDEVLGALKTFADTAEQVRSLLERPVPAPPGLVSLAAELRQLEAEFGEANIDWKGKALTAATEPITLRGVALGAFAIRLRWDRLEQDGAARCFEIVALNPNPAGSDERVTHPHVKDNTLCAGEAAAPLHQALAGGRLADAFCLVRAVLTTYNPGSPHVPLSDWAGGACHDCGCLPGDDRCACPVCGHDFCADCTRQCDHCEAVRCTDCMGRCAVCESYCCAGCSTTAAASGRECCQDCVRSCQACRAAVAADELAEGTSLCAVCAAKGQPTAATAPGPTGPSPDPTSPSFCSETGHESTLAPAAPRGA
jgi:hypothetical protein